MTTHLVLETPCEHGRMPRHRISDDVMCSAGYCVHTPIHKLCNGGSKEKFTPNIKAAAKALAFIDDGRRWELIPDGVQLLYETQAKETVAAAFTRPGDTL